MHTLQVQVQVFLYNAACVYACVFSASGCIGEHVRLERHIPLHSVYAWLYMYACTYKVGTHYTHNIPGMMYTCSYKYIYICMYMYICLYMYIYIYIFIFIHICMHLYPIHIYIYIHVPHTVLFAGAQPWDVGVLAFAAEPSALSCWQPMCDTYVYIYAHIYIHITHIYNTCTRASYTYIYICTYTCMHVHIYILLHIFIYIHRRVCMCIYTCMHRYEYKKIRCIYVHVYMCVYITHFDLCSCIKNIPAAAFGCSSVNIDALHTCTHVHMYTCMHMFMYMAQPYYSITHTKHALRINKMYVYICTYVNACMYRYIQYTRKQIDNYAHVHLVILQPKKIMKDLLGMY